MPTWAYGGQPVMAKQVASTEVPPELLVLLQPLSICQSALRRAGTGKCGWRRGVQGDIQWIKESRSPKSRPRQDLRA